MRTTPNFYKCVVANSGILEGEIIVSSIVHWWNSPIVATATSKGRFTNLYFSSLMSTQKDCFEPVPVSELHKLKPHLRKTIIPDYLSELNRVYLSELSIYCCYDCGNKKLQTFPDKQKKNTIGNCEMCGTKKTDLYHKEKFRINIFK